MSASTKCPHPDIHYNINTVNFEDSNVKSVEITAKCNVCEMPMVFFGCPLGVSFKQPTASLGGHEIRLPMGGEQDEPVVKSGLVGAVLTETPSHRRSLAMKMLADLHPQWLGQIRPNSGETISFDCPACGPSHRVAAHFSNPLDGQPPAPWLKPPAPIWQREGDDFATLTVRPSMNYPCWHGWIERGHVFSVEESPITALVLIDGRPQPVALSPLQVLDIAKRAEAMFQDKVRVNVEAPIHSKDK